MSGLRREACSYGFGRTLISYARGLASGSLVVFGKNFERPCRDSMCSQPSEPRCIIPRASMVVGTSAPAGPFSSIQSTGKLGVDSPRELDAAKGPVSTMATRSSNDRSMRSVLVSESLGRKTIPTSPHQFPFCSGVRRCARRPAVACGKRLPSRPSAAAHPEVAVFRRGCRFAVVGPCCHGCRQRHPARRRLRLVVAFIALEQCPHVGGCRCSRSQDLPA